MFKESGVSVPPPQTKPTERLYWVDYARGIAIILVVYRHVVVGMMRAGIAIPRVMFDFQELFYNFRMPLFFLLSGVFVGKSLHRKTPGLIVKDRASTLLYPYLLWGSILITLQIIFSKFTNSQRSPADYLYLFTQPRNIDHLWYLLALFNTSMLFLLLNQFIKKGMVQFAIAMVLHALTITSLLENNSLLADLCYFYVYFVCGVESSKLLLSPDFAQRFVTTRNLAILLPVFVLGQWFWFRHMDEEATYLPVFFVITLVGCAVVYVLSYFLAKLKGSRWLAFVGEHSLYIYILHVTIAAMLRGALMRLGFPVPPVIILLICWVCGIVIPIVLYRGLKNFGFRKLFSLKQTSAA